MNERHTMLKTKAQFAGESARLLVEKADRERRAMTAAERSQFDGLIAEGRQALDQIDQLKSDQNIMDQAKAFAASVGSPISSSSKPRGVKARDWAAGVAKQMGQTADHLNVKALINGNIDVPNVISSSPVTLPDNPTRLIDLLVNNQPLTGGREFEYVRQTVRQNNAAPVADNALKPTSIFTWDPFTDTAKVIAHLSEPIPERFFSDFASLLQILESEMFRGVREAVEAQVVLGDGEGENMTGFFATSGVVNQAYTTSLFTTLRKARTGFQTREEVPTAWAFNPADAERFDLSQDANDRYYDDLKNIFGDVRQVVSNSIPAGQALLGDFDQCGLFVREDIQFAADRSGPLFDRNQVKLRAEGRFGFAVLRPQAFTIVDLTA